MDVENRWWPKVLVLERAKKSLLWVEYYLAGWFKKAKFMNSTEDLDVCQIQLKQILSEGEQPKSFNHLVIKLYE